MLQGPQHIGHDAVFMDTDEHGPDRVAKSVQRRRSLQAQIGLGLTVCIQDATLRSHCQAQVAVVGTSSGSCSRDPPQST
ncbi:hypothetical protein B9Z51_10500 [Limnohabitans sp. T6-5]|nr:hypothetical protein B9Z51_10500 [Limnohabitans sp. T6-5]